MKKEERLTPIQFQQRMEAKYKGKNCSLQIPGYKQVQGLVDEIIFFGTKWEIVIQMNDRRYTVSPESIKECLKLLKNGDTY